MPETQSNNTKPDTAETKVRRSLEVNPGATAATLASTAGVGRSTATKILSRWAAEGLVVRTAGKDQSVPVTWMLRGEQDDDDAEVAATAETVPATDEDDETAPSGIADAREPSPSPVPVADVSSTSVAETPQVSETPTKERLPKGALYELVKEFLQAHPGEEFGPAKIGTELVRSSGAVNNALEKLVANGLATKTCEAPKRFTCS